MIILQMKNIITGKKHRIIQQKSIQSQHKQPLLSNIPIYLPHKGNQQKCKVKSIIKILQPITQVHISSIIQICSENKLFFHSFKKFTTYSFLVDQIMLESANIVDIANQIKLQQSNSHGNDNLVFVIGGNESGVRSVCQGNKHQQGLFLTLMAQFIKQGQQLKHKYYVQFGVICDGDILDVFSGLQIQIRQDSSTKYEFINSKIIEIKSRYDLYSSFQQAILKRKTYSNNTIFFVVSTVQTSQGTSNKNMLMEWELSNKFSKGTQENCKHQTHSLLILNQCILQLIKHQQLKVNIHPPFRDSKLTRLLKPYLLSNSQNTVIGCIDRTQKNQQYTLQTLTLLKHLGKLSTKIKKQRLIKSRLTSEGDYSKQKIQFFKMAEQNAKMKKQLQSLEKNHQNYYINQWLIKSIEKQKNLELQKLKTNLKLEILKSQLYTKIVQNTQSNTKSFQLCRIEIDTYQQKIKSIEGYIKSAQNQRIQRILKEQNINNKQYFIKEYLRMSLKSNDQFQEEYLKNCKQKRKTIQHNLQFMKSQKESPKKSIKKIINHEVQQKIKSRSNTQPTDILPKFTKSLEKRRAILKSKLKEGRVDLKNFFSNNAQRYQQYEIKN